MIQSIDYLDPIFPVKWSRDSNNTKNKNDSLNENKIKKQEEEKNTNKSWNNELYKSMIKTKWLSQTFAFSDCMKSTQTFTKELSLILIFIIIIIINY